MTTYWAIAIGINQYRCFQPLMYAQRDAQALWSYWASEGRFPTEQCWLLTDALTASDSSAIIPDRDTIESTVEEVCRQLHPDDVLWCFFSGYGVRFEGHDYLMPIDGDPNQVALTGISVESLLKTLRSAPTNNIVLVLDMNRSQGILDGAGVGQETIALANQLGIPTLLASHPNQFSYETLALRQGLFTAAILEGLRFQGCATVSQLAAYVGDRLPELSEHHCRPRQDSVAIIPNSHQHLLLVPEQALVMSGVPYRSPGVETGSGASTAGVAPDYKNYPNQIPKPTPVNTESSYTGGNGFAPKEYALKDKVPVTPGGLDAVGHASSPDDTDALFWRRWRPWILGAIAFLVLAVLLQNRDTFSNEPLPEASPTSSVTPNPLSSASPGATNPGTTLPTGSSLTAQTLNPEGAGANISSAEEPDPTAIPDPNAQPQPNPLPEGVANPSPLPGDGSAVPSPSPNGSLPVSPGLQLAQVALRSQQYEEASRQLARVPTEQRNENYVALLQQTNQGLLVQARASLSRPRALSATNQASDFSTAIQLASRIQPEQPLYAEAQQDIDRWSQIILELARSRASQPNRGSALIAAQNYSTAIRAAGLVPANRPQLYATAQQYIAQWSQTMMAIAQARASEGRLDVAIRTAQLVPRNAPSYGVAAQAIAQWEAQLGYYY